LKPKASAGRTRTPQRPATTRDSKDHLCRKHRWPAGLYFSQAAPAAASACPAPSDTTKTSCNRICPFRPTPGARRIRRTGGLFPRYEPVYDPLPWRFTLRAEPKTRWFGRPFILAQRGRTEQRSTSYGNI